MASRLLLARTARPAFISSSAIARRTFASAHAVDEGQVLMPDKSAKDSEFLHQREEVKHHAEQTTRLWMQISWFICIPAIIGGGYWVSTVEAAHAAHEEHIKAEHDGHLPEKPEYDYLNKRGKPFPWGNNSLFFNPHTQKDMSIKSE